MKEFAEEWFEAETSIDETTLAEFDKYVAEYLAERAVAEKIESELTEQNKKLQKMQDKLLAYLDAQGKSKHVTSAGTISRVSKVQWKAPEGEGREEILELLRKTGRYDSVMAFNANKFSAWYAQEIEQGHQLPGVEKKETTYIRFLKGS